MTRRFWWRVAARRCRSSCSRWRRCCPGSRCSTRSPRRAELGRSSRSPRRWCSGAAGRSSSAAGRRSSTGSLEHVHADRARHRASRTSTASSRRSRRGSFPPSFRDARRRVAVYFEAAAVIVALVLLGQVLELRARSRPARRSARCSAWRRRPRAASRDDGSEDGRAARPGARRRSPARAAGREGAGRRRRARRRAAPSTSRWSPASRSRSRRRRATGSPAARSTAPAASSCAPSASARDTLLAQIVRWSARRSAAARRFSGWPTRSPA